MSVVGEVVQVALELVLDSVNSWRMIVALVATGILVWLILDYGPQGAAGTTLAVVVAIGGLLIGWRWSRAAEEG
jgi:FtsH-binding integral membrane protein